MAYIHTLFRLLLPGGAKSIVAKNTALRRQLLILSRKQKRSTNLKVEDRFLLDLYPEALSFQRIIKNSVIQKPATILHFQKALKERKYQRLYSSKPNKRPGPKWPSQEVINVTLEIKKRNPRSEDPYLPTSHPFVERLIGTVRRELLDQTLYWNSTDLQRKLDQFKEYYNHDRTHSSRKGMPLVNRPRKTLCLSGFY